MDTGTSQLAPNKESDSDLKITQPWDEGAGLVGSPGSKTMKQYTLEEVRDHWEMKSCWIILYDFVYDITTFLHEHPGGSEILIEHAGRDSTSAFKGKGHSEEAHKMLQKYCIGQLVTSERIYASRVHGEYR